MDVQIVDLEIVTEPITINEAKAYLQIDADYASNDNDIALTLSTARKRLEAFLNIGLVNRKITVFWGGYELELPLSPNGDILTVKKGSTQLNENDYSVLNLPAKRISINSIGGLSGNWFYSLSGQVEFTALSQANTDVFSCEYNTGFTDLPADLKQAILAETAHLYKLRGEPVVDIISPNASLLANSYSRNLII